MSIPIEALVTTVLIVAIETIGVVEWLKRLMPNKTVYTGKKPPNRKAKFAIVSFMVLIPCAVINTELVEPMATTVYNVFFLGLAITQIGYTAVTNSIPKLIESLFNKVSNSPSNGDNIQ
jgi:uncharacterized membrane protein YjdF